MPDSSLESARGEVILVAVKREDGAVSLFSRSNLEQLVATRDRGYIEELLDDMVERAKDFPNELFEQLSNLSVGPVVSGEIELIEAREADISALYPDFVAADVRRGS
jgi:hypothetical protein